MQKSLGHTVLVEAWGRRNSDRVLLKEATLVSFGILVLILGAKISVPMWPVPVTMGTFAVLGLGALYGPRLGLTTILLYFLVGVAGFDVFHGSSPVNNGLSYMSGPTGGYLLGYLLATLVLGLSARSGWDRSPRRMFVVLLAGNFVIYVPGILWLGVLLGWDKPILAWGLTPFLVGDSIKLALLALLLPAARKLFWKKVDQGRDR